MKQIVKLGTELAAIADDITDVFVTQDHYEWVRGEYHSAIDSFIDRETPENTNFQKILKLRRVIDRDLLPGAPCTDMTIDTPSVKESLDTLDEYSSLYHKFIYSGFKKDISSMDDSLEKNLLSNCLRSIMNKSSDLREYSIALDSYMGSYFTTEDLLNSLVAYGRISGLMDWWTGANLKNT